MKEIIVIQSKAIIVESMLAHIAKHAVPESTELPAKALTEAGYTIKICGSMQELREKCPDGLSKDAVLVLGSKFANGEKTDAVVAMIGEKLQQRTAIFTGDSRLRATADDRGFSWFIDKPATGVELDQMAKKIIELLN